MSNTKLSSDINSVIAAINSADANGAFSFDKNAAATKENTNQLVDFIVEFSEGSFSPIEMKGARAKDAFSLIHNESGKVVRFNTFGNKNIYKNDILASVTAIYSCVFKDFPQNKENQSEFYDNHTLEDLVDNAPYILVINFKKGMGERMSIHHLFDLNLYDNLSGEGKFQTDYTLSEKRITPLEFFKKADSLQEKADANRAKATESRKAMLTK